MITRSTRLSYFRETREDLSAILSKNSSDDIAELVEHVLTTNRYDRYRISNREKTEPGRVRTIHAPIPELKKVQQRIRKKILATLAHPQAHGFVEGKSHVTGIQDMISRMNDKRIGSVFQTDIHNFFPHITFDEIEEIFRKEMSRFQGKKIKHVGYISGSKRRKIASILADICSYEGGLPQGPPTSPDLSNLVFRKLDTRIQETCDSQGVIYGRYADDIVLMSSTGAKELLPVGETVCDIMSQHDFPTHPGKTEIQENQEFYRIWGLHLHPSNGEPIFRLPGSKIRRYSNHILETTREDHSCSHDDIKRSLRHRQAHGYLSYAHHVIKNGEPSCSHDGLVLPKKLGFAWGKYRERFGDFLDKKDQEKFDDR